MSNFKIDRNKLTLYVKKSPLFIRSFILFFAFFSICMPLGGLILRMAIGDGFHFRFLFGITIFGILGFYLLKVFLWNTYGKEIIQFSDTEIKYIADYKWFKSEKVINPISNIYFTIKNIGYEDEKIGVLIINNKNHETQLETTTKLSIQSLTRLIKELDSKFV